MIRKRLFVSGRVQNVFYRDWMIEQAQALGIDGWVRNRADGRVEALLDGPRESVDELERRAGQGPSAARVATVEAVEEERRSVIDGFGRRPTV